MSSKQEIKDLFTTELVNTPQYQIVLDIKQAILDEIAAPNVVPQFMYNFETPQSEEEVNIIKLCMIVEFGFDTKNISSNCVVVDMNNFLV